MMNAIAIGLMLISAGILAYAVHYLTAQLKEATDEMQVYKTASELASKALHDEQVKHRAFLDTLLPPEELAARKKNCSTVLRADPPLPNPIARREREWWDQLRGTS